jgi:FRG domain
MALPDDYWVSYEHEASSLAEFLEAVRKISAYQAATGSRFVWRDAANASWALHSSLALRYKDREGAIPSTEGKLRAFEREVLDEARAWGLDWHGSGGRLMALELLAALQHYGVPTRMLDFTFNPLIALWFAVETVPKDDGEYGRVFAIDISGRLVAREDASLPDPWWLKIEPRSDTEWTTSLGSGGLLRSSRASCAKKAAFSSAVSHQRIRHARRVGISSMPTRFGHACRFHSG